MKTRHKTIYGVEPFLALPALALATVSAVVVALALFHAPVPQIFIQGLLYANGALVVALFLRILLSRAHHYAIAEAKTEMTGSPFIQPKLKGPSLNHPEWGLWGSKQGSGFLQWLRLPSLIVFAVALFFSRGETALPLLIAATGFALTVLLTLTQMTDHYPLTND